MPLALLFPAAYLISCLVYGFILGIRAQSACHTIAGLAAIVMHMSWGAGFLYEFVRTVPSVLPSRSSKTVHISGKRK
jgi:succinoglycan biosynthesis protein ExoA